MTQNKHIEHPEDTILTGDLTALDWIAAAGTLSVKMDGAPAIVWGVDPSNGQWFCGTKSVFNKRKFKVPYSLEDVEKYYGNQPSLANVLKACFKYLPRTEGIYQGDFIGFGGSELFQPNTVVYEFPEIIDEKIVVAPHTYYEGDTLKDAVAFPLVGDLISTSSCLFVQPFVDWEHHSDYSPSIVSEYDHVGFLDDKEADEAKVAINALIRAGKPLDDATLTHILGCPHLTNLYQMVTEIKEELMNTFIVYGSPKASLNGQRILAEGFVFYYDNVGLKLVDRPVFSYANFNHGRFQR